MPPTPIRPVCAPSVFGSSPARSIQKAARPLIASFASSRAGRWLPVSCTGDKQWIHVDVERARRESPFGGPIAHGYLTLSLVAAMVMELGVIPQDADTGLNYGLDKVRFIAPVKAGARVRMRASLASAEP